MVLTRTFACATPVAASDNAGYRDVMTVETSVSFRAGDGQVLGHVVTPLLGDELRRPSMGATVRRRTEERCSWRSIVRRPVEVHEAAGAR